MPFCPFGAYIVLFNFRGLPPPLYPDGLSGLTFKFLPIELPIPLYTKKKPHPLLIVDEIRKLIEKAEHALAVAENLLRSGYPSDAASKVYYYLTDDSRWNQTP